MLLNAHVHVQRLLERYFDQFCSNYVQVFKINMFNISIGCIFGWDGYFLMR